MLQCRHFSFHWPSLPLSSFSPSGCSLLPRLDVQIAARRRRIRRLHSARKPPQWTCEISDAEVVGEEEGPVLLPPSSSSSLSSSIFATTDDPSPLQVSASFLLTGAISVFLFRSLRRRAKRAKEMKFRSSGSTSANLRDEAIESLKAMSTSSIETGKSPSAVQAFLGGIAAGVIALILYKFATTIEASLNRQTISDNFSVRQITVTIRTIINGLCYLATFIFGINAVGLILYSGQLAVGSLMAPPAEESEKSEKIGGEGYNPGGSDNSGETEGREE